MNGAEFDGWLGGELQRADAALRRSLPYHCLPGDCRDAEHCQQGGRCEDAVGPDDDIVAIMADDRLVTAVSLSDPYRTAALDRLAGWNGTADVELRQLLGGWRDAIHARRLPPMNLDSGRIAHQLSQARRRRRVPVQVWWAIALMVACWLTAVVTLWVALP